MEMEGPAEQVIEMQLVMANQHTMEVQVYYIYFFTTTTIRKPFAFPSSFGVY